MSNLSLSVHIDPASGFCFGVVHAIQLAESLLDEQGYLYCLGDIVHNDEEIKRLNARGLATIDYEQLAMLHDETVLIRAHGEPPATYALAMRNNLTLVDASCPVILKLQNRLKNSCDKQEKVLIFGTHGHAEVVGLIGQAGGRAIVFESLSELLNHELPIHVTLYSQTTKSTTDFYAIKTVLEDRGHIVNANDTICRQVSNRDKYLRTFVTRFDQIIFVAGAKSANGKALYEVCREVNPQTRFISRADELDRSWFAPLQTVGICSATSTPLWLMEQVRDYLLNL